MDDLPAGWTLQKDPETKTIFYYNEETHAVCMERPGPEGAAGVRQQQQQMPPSPSTPTTGRPPYGTNGQTLHEQEPLTASPTTAAPHRVTDSRSPPATVIIGMQRVASSPTAAPPRVLDSRSPPATVIGMQPLATSPTAAAPQRAADATSPTSATVIGMQPLASSPAAAKPQRVEDYRSPSATMIRMQPRGTIAPAAAPAPAAPSPAKVPTSPTPLPSPPTRQAVVIRFSPAPKPQTPTPTPPPAMPPAMPVPVPVPMPTPPAAATHDDTDEAMLEAARQYVRIDPNGETQAAVAALLAARHTAELRKILGTRLAFGTAGLRGPMGAGYNRMNDLVILQTTQGLAVHLMRRHGDDVARRQGVVIGYDHRKLGSLSSLGFARVAAAVLLSQGFKVYLLEGFVPTPFVAYGVRLLGAVAGIMVTASHNPPADNGFKLYAGNGSQIIPPEDTEVARAIEENLAPWQGRYDVEGVPTHPLAADVATRVADAYYTALMPRCGAQSKLPVVYTAMHGVGAKWLDRAFALAGHAPVVPVWAQRDPDPAFPTVAFPNPEEKGALDMAISTADQVGSAVIIANDPDADRLAAAEKQPDGRWHVFSGNELGVLLAHWQILKWKGSPFQPAVPAVLTTVVSSRMLKAMAEAEGVEYHETLTGFKWLGNKTNELAKCGRAVLFSYEEALGYCVGDAVADKDGISAAVVFVEMAAALRKVHGKSVMEYLQRLYALYGQFVSYNGYVISRQPAVTDSIFALLRTSSSPSSSGGGSGGAPGQYWSQAAGVAIVSVKDVTLGYDSASPTRRADLPLTPDSHMIMYAFANGCTVTLRTSGTEPKIKWYAEMRGDAGGRSPGDLAAALKAFVDRVVDEILQPEARGLQRM